MFPDQAAIDCFATVSSPLPLPLLPPLHGSSRDVPAFRRYKGRRVVAVRATRRPREPTTSPQQRNVNGLCSYDASSCGGRIADILGGARTREGRNNHGQRDDGEAAAAPEEVRDDDRCGVGTRRQASPREHAGAHGVSFGGNCACHLRPRPSWTIESLSKTPGFGWVTRARSGNCGAAAPLHSTGTSDQC